MKHPNCGLVTPLWQGDGCIGLSGLYACLNGIRLLLADQRDITAPETDRLFRAGLRVLDGRLSPQQCVANGLRVQLWRQLVAAMATNSMRILNKRVIAERLFVEKPGRAAAFEALERAIESLRVVLMLRDGGQYTVVSGLTAQSLILFDSGGACWIAKRLCGLPGQALAQHTFYTASFMALSV